MKYDGITMIGDATNERFLLKTEGARVLYAIGINPSTASDAHADATMRKVMGFAERNGFDGFAMLNLYPQRTTDPRGLHERRDDNLHRRNLSLISELFSGLHRPVVLLAYGNAIGIRPYLRDCLHDIVQAIQPSHPQWKQIGTQTRQGHPRHPLYARYATLCDCNVTSLTTRPIPPMVKTIADEEACNNIEYVGAYDGKDVYALGEVGDDGLPIPTGLPMLVLWDGKHTDVVSGEESLVLLGQLDMP